MANGDDHVSQAGGDPSKVPAFARRWVASRRTDGLLAPSLFLLAAVTLGYALQLNNGAYGPEPIRYVTISLPTVTGPRVVPVARVLSVGVAFQLALMVGAPPGIYIRTPFWSSLEVQFALLLAALLVGIGVMGGRTARSVVVPILFAIHLTLALWTVNASRPPRIDVYSWHSEAFAALAQHVDPYAITMPNIYGSTQWYAPGLATYDRVLVGYPYPPLSLILAWLGNFFGDYRYTNVLATTFAGAFMAYARPGPLATLAASVFWFSPRLLLVLEQGWTEPQVILLLSFCVFAACRTPKLLALALGLLLAVKQYTIFVMPFAFLLQRKPDLRSYLGLLARAVVIAAVLTLPWLLWNPHAFFESVIAFQSKQPLRPDALSYLAWATEKGWKARTSMSFVMLVPAALIAILRSPRTPSGFAGAAALLFLSFFAFAKQAFCNYYMMIVGALCCAAAAAAAHTPSDPRRES